MSRLLALLAVASVTLLSASASADTTVDPDGTTWLPTITIYGRANKPSVMVILKTPTAANAAAAAHEDMRAGLVQKSEPAALRSSR